MEGGQVLLLHCLLIGVVECRLFRFTVEESEGVSVDSSEWCGGQTQLETIKPAKECSIASVDRTMGFICNDDVEESWIECLVNLQHRWIGSHIDSLVTIPCSVRCHIGGWFLEEDRKEFELREGDLLICEGGEVGRTAIWRNELNSVFFQKALHRVRLDLSITNPEYVQSYMLFMAKNGGFGDFTNSATIAHLTGVKLKMLPIPIPPLNIQKNFSKIFKSIERQKILLNSQLVSQNMLFGSLQQRAFKGEL